MSNNSGNSFFAFLSGAAVGTLIGILYAPDKGKNTRDKLSYRLEQYKDKLQELIDELIDGKEEISSEARERNRQINQDVIQKAESIMGDIDNLFDSIHAQKKEQAEEE